MHELSIAAAVVEIASEHARGRRVTKVELKVGHLRQVVPSALELAFDLVARDTPLEGAKLELRHVPARIACRGCGREQEVADFPLACLACGSVEVEVVAGKELSVEALEVEDEPVTAGRR
jgi:hydrogenase nickel incorporation protein HypA/HybF